jgi:hypothetical protein
MSSESNSASIIAENNNKYIPSPPQELLNQVYDYLLENLPKCYWNQSVSINCGSQVAHSHSSLFNKVLALNTTEFMNSEAQNQYQTFDITYKVLIHFFIIIFKTFN